MTLAHIMGLLGGLALFLYGMQMMSSGLESVRRNRMKQILEKLTANRFLGVLVGAVITAVIQSSSATTVMVVGFVNSGMMTFAAGSLDYYGCQYWYHNYRTNDCFGCWCNCTVDCLFQVDL